MTIDSVLSSVNKYGDIEINRMRIFLLDKQGYQIAPGADAQQVDAIEVQTIRRNAVIDDDFVEDLARTFGLVYSANGRSFIYIEGSSQDRLYIVSRATAEKDYRAIYWDEIEAFGEHIVDRDLSGKCILGSFETREVRT